MPTLLDIARANNADRAIPLIDEATKILPTLIAVPSRTIPGTEYRTLVRTGVPSVAFRNANEGSATVSNTYENRLVQTYIAEPIWRCDRAVADKYIDGADAFIFMEATGILEGAMQSVAKCFFYGTDATHGDAKAFPGLLQTYDSTNFVVDAGGTTATTGSSVWAIRTGPQDVQWVWGNNGDFSLDDPRVETVNDGSSNPYTAYVQSMMLRPGLQVGRVDAVGRIKKLTADSGKTLTDDLIFQLLGKFPANKFPNHLFMTLRSLMQLQASRTATTPTGAPAPLPTHFDVGDGRRIPIHVTDSLSNVEALTL